MKKNKKMSNGITLIALVVTIIVLLILAGISISMLSGENGILQKATEAKTRTEIGQEKDIVALAYNSALAKKMNNGDSITLIAEDINAELTDQGAYAEDRGSKIIVTFEKSHREYTLDAIKHLPQNMGVSYAKAIDTDNNGQLDLLIISGEKVSTSDIQSLGTEIKDYGDTKCENPWKSDLFKFTKVKIMDTIYPTSMEYWFSGSGGYGHSLNNITEIEGLEKIDTTYCTSLASVFDGCQYIKNLDLTMWNTDNVKSLNNTFSHCSALENLNVSNWNVSNVTDFNSTFSCCESVKSLDVSKWDTRSATTMRGMFYYMRALESLDIADFNTSNVTDLSWMFYTCENLESLDLNKWDVSKVEAIQATFDYCKKIKSIKVDQWNTSSLQYATSAFSACYILESLDLSGWNTPNLKSMSAMFFWCHKLSDLKMDNLDTSNVESFSRMFNACRALNTVDLSNFNSSSVTDMSAMFYDCTVLQTIYVGNKFTTNNVTESNNMFYNCTNLKGGNGTKYNFEKNDKTYAQIDTSSTPGYFTLKN